MACLPLIFALSLAVATAVAFTQVEFSARMMHPTSRLRSFENAMNGYGYGESTTVTLEEQRKILNSRMPTPIDENMSKYQVEFRELLKGILYTEKEIQTVLNPRMRAILKGIAASYYDIDVYGAFEILYEDYIPIRVAGRVVYRELRKVMDESKQYQLSQIDKITKVTGMSRSDIEDCWSTFTQITSDRKLFPTDLENYVGTQTLKFVFYGSSVSVCVEAEEKGEISFEQLLISLYESSMIICGDGSDSTSARLSGANPSTGNILQQAFEMNDAVDKRNSEEQILSPKRQKYNRRYDDMLIQFSKWKPLIPSGNGRRLQILKGCFVGSENPAVVEALRIIYVDYAALRLSGDWIFKVVSALMGPAVRRNNERQKKSLQL